MKGFIEVNIITGWNEESCKRKFLIAIENIKCVDGWSIQLKRPIKIEYRNTCLNEKGINRYAVETDITYEEIKQKIKEATEPRLIVGGNGEIKEI